MANKRAYGRNKEGRKRGREGGGTGSERMPCNTDGGKTLRVRMEGACRNNNSPWNPGGGTVSCKNKGLKENKEGKRWPDIRGSKRNTGAN